jgi:hypothetical protein
VSGREEGREREREREREGERQTDRKRKRGSGDRPVFVNTRWFVNGVLWLVLCFFLGGLVLCSL